jgi:GT2 family glycosyltransferase
MVNFAIGIPTLNRFDLLYPSLILYTQDMPSVEIFIIDNGNQNINLKFKHPNIKVIESEFNMGVAASWNLLCREIFAEHEYAIILNDDVYLGKKDYEIDMFLKQFPQKEFYLGTQDFCSFILPKSTYEKVGEFDESFYPAYFEDNDYFYRMRLAHINYFVAPIINPILYRSSMTAQKDPNVLNYVKANEKRYIEKWGGLPESEKYLKPYNKTE